MVRAARTPNLCRSMPTARRNASVASSSGATDASVLNTMATISPSLPSTASACTTALRNKAAAPSRSPADFRNAASADSAGPATFGVRGIGGAQQQRRRRGRRRNRRQRTCVFQSLRRVRAESLVVQPKSLAVSHASSHSITGALQEHRQVTRSLSGARVPLSEFLTAARQPLFELATNQSGIGLHCLSGKREGQQYRATRNHQVDYGLSSPCASIHVRNSVIQAADGP